MGFFNSSPLSLARCPSSLMVAGGSYFGLRRPKSRRQWRQDGGLLDCGPPRTQRQLSVTPSPQLAPPKCSEKKSFLSRDDGLCRGVRKQRGLERRHTPKPPTNALKDMAEKGGWFWHRGGQGGLPGHRTLELGTKGEEEISAMDKAVCKVSGRRWGLRSECSQCISQTVKRCTRLLVTQKPAAHRDGGAWAAGGVRSLCLDSSKGYLTASRN